MEEQNRNIRSYVLRQGRMSKGQRDAYESLRDRYCIPFSDNIEDIQFRYPEKQDLIIEIGFGMGSATAEIAMTFPEKNFLGIEVHTPGVGKLLGEIKGRGLLNLRIIQHDAVEVLSRMVPDGALSGLHIFFPDPWPKKKHHKRRLLKREFLALAAKKLKDDGYIYICTDWENYANQIVAAIEEEPDLKNHFGGFSPPVKWRPRTRFEEKGLVKKHRIYEVYATRCRRCE